MWKDKKSYSSIGYEYIEDILAQIGKGTVDLSSYSNFIDPSIWAVLLCEKLRRKHIGKQQIEIIKPSDNSKSYVYLEKITGQNDSLTTIPLRTLSPVYRDEADNFARDFIELFDVKDDNLKKFLRYIVAELITNTIDHSDSIVDVVCCGQLFPNLDMAEIAVVDAGVGFKNTLKTKYKVKTDEEAILKAIEKGVSGYTANKGKYSYYKNAGYGLYVIHNIVKNYDGILKIISRKGSVTWKSDNLPTVFSLTDEQTWYGSIVIVRFRTDRISGLDFNDFLRNIIKGEEAEDEELF